MQEDARSLGLKKTPAADMPANTPRHHLRAPLLQQQKVYIAPANKVHELSTSLVLLGKGRIGLFLPPCALPSAIKVDRPWPADRPATQALARHQLAFEVPVLLSRSPFQPLHGCRGVVKVAACRLSHQIHQLRGVKAAFGIGLHPQQPKSSDPAQTDILPAA